MGFFKWNPVVRSNGFHRHGLAPTIAVLCDFTVVIRSFFRDRDFALPRPVRVIINSKQYRFCRCLPETRLRVNTGAETWCNLDSVH